MLRAGLGYAFVVCALVAIVTVSGAPVGPSFGEVAAAGGDIDFGWRITGVAGDVLMVDRGDGGDGDILERRSFFGKIGHAIGHATHAVTHAVTHVVHAATHAVGQVVHAVAHPISAIKDVVSTIHHTIKHVASTIHHTIKHVASTIHHVVKHVVKGVKDTIHFIKKNGPTIAKIGLKMLASSQGVLATVSKFIPGVGIPMSQALKAEAQGLDMASG